MILGHCGINLLNQFSLFDSRLHIVMRPSIVISALLPLALAGPVPQSGDLQIRQLSSSTSNDVESGSCHDVTFIFARGSTETGNMVC